LTSESEERETWTAESLRTVVDGRSLLRSGGAVRTRLRRSTFQVNTLMRKHQSDGPRQWRRASVAVRNVIGREKVLIQLESLILAQSERWRQA
jgi:hypothetical protein